MAKSIANSPGRRMVSGAAGPITSAGGVLAISLVGAFFLPAAQFGLWALLNSVMTASMTLDFGGATLVAARYGTSPDRGSILRRGIAYSTAGSLAIGLVATAAWIPYSQTEGSGDWGFVTGLLALQLTIVAGIVRSTSAVLASAALAFDSHRLRNFILVGQTVLALLISLALLPLLNSAWVLPVAWLFASVMSVAVGWRPVRSSAGDVGGRVSVTHDESDRKFARNRSVVTILMILLLQGDRWIVGAAGGAAFLAVYEIAWRIASIPRTFAVNICLVLVADGTKTLSLRISEAIHFLKRAQIITLLTTGVTSAGAVLVLLILSKSRDSPSLLIMGLALLAGLALNGATSALISIGLSRGRSTIGLTYIALVALGTITCWVIAIVTNNAWIAVFGGPVLMAIGSVAFVVTGMRQVIGDINRRNNPNPPLDPASVTSR